MTLRENWRIIMLVVLVVLSTIALFAPTGSAGSAGTDSVASDPTNLDYGLELSGGTRLRAQLEGFTAQNVEVTADNLRDIEQTVASELSIDRIDVAVRRTGNATGTVEVFELTPTAGENETQAEPQANVTKERFAAALTAAGLDVTTDQIRAGVTSQTLETARDTLDNRINRGGLTGGGASLVRSATGQDFLVIEVPNANRSEVLDLVGDPGRVQIVAGFPIQGPNGTEHRRVPLLTQGDFAQISPARQAGDGVAAHVQVTLTQDAAQNFTNAMNQFGFAQDGGVTCRYEMEPDSPGYCLYTVVDGETVYGAGVNDGLADSFRDRQDFLNNPTFLMQTGTGSQAYSEAQELKINLESGALPTELDIQSEMYLAPSLAQKFKPLALITGLVAWLAVSGAVFYRYREPKVAVPMLLTAAAEVFLLLGFAAAIGLALDLSHIAGFIAVIGTGVDDLIIIADEILQRGEIKTGRVFKNRFRKAFWVIGAAAATTIIAMSPLAVLSLGDLQGFAIVTIVGVLIGVLVTRPAYGDIIRNLLLEEE